MKKLFIFIALFVALAINSFAQDSLPSSFEFKTDSNGNYQLLPKEEEIFDDANKDSVQQFVGIAAYPEQNLYGLVLYYIQPEKQDYFLEKQKSPKITLSVGDSIRNFSNYKLDKRNVRGRKIEIVTFQISPEDYEMLQSSLASIIFGTYKFNVSESNFTAFRYFRTSVNNDLVVRRRARELPTLNNSGDVQVKGYYRKDGTYVRPHTRSRRKN
jgi:hypothetical protein